VKCGLAPGSHQIRVGAVFEQVLDALKVVPIGLAEEHRSQALGAEPAALDKGLQHAHLVRLGCVIGRLPVVGIGAVGQKEPCQPFVMGDARRTIEDTFPFGVWLVVAFPPAAVGARAGVE
jgi:hypothetical protein